ncbi:MAG: AbrB/MazE/SpoVT family DNA-binding domain-containing protein [Acidobacteriota bacterium]
METTIDRAGRVVIPKAVREQAGLCPGQPLRVEWRDGKVGLEPVRQEPKLVRRGKRYVLAAPPGTPPLGEDTVRRVIEEIREERIRRISSNPR